MQDPNETRVIANNWREYLAESKESFAVYAWAWREFVTPESMRWVKLGSAALMGWVVLNVAQSLVLKSVFDGLIARDSRSVIVGLLGFGGIVVALRLLFWAYDYCREWTLGIDMATVDRRSSELFFGKSLGQHLRDSGILTPANVDKGRNRILEVKQLLAFEGFPALLDFTLSFVCLFVISLVAGAGMVLALAIYLAFMLYVNRKVTEVCTPIDADLRKLNRYRVERWDMVERVKTNGKEAEEVASMHERFERIMAVDRPFWHGMFRFYTARSILTSLIVVGLMGYGAWLAWSGVWSIGMLYPFYQWLQRVSDNMTRIGQIEHRLNWNMPSVRSLKDALTLPPDITDATNAVRLDPSVPLRVSFEGVGHGYSSGASRSHVLAGVSFTIEPGEKVALIGPSGAGKTTIMRLLQRYMDPDAGRITLNGIDLRDIVLSTWRTRVGYIAQHAQVFGATVRDNLLYGLPESERALVTDDMLWSVMRELRIDLGDRLTQGLDTRVGQRGIRLSGGEAQRLMIGAAVVKRPTFMIIDEATSSLDSSTEKDVQGGLAKALAPETSALIIAHRLSTIRYLCTKFVVVRPATGQCKDQVEAVAGSFEELYSLSPTFRRLADDQQVVVASVEPRMIDMGRTRT